MLEETEWKIGLQNYMCSRIIEWEIEYEWLYRVGICKCVHIHVHVYLGIRMFIENDWKDTHSTLTLFPLLVMMSLGSNFLPLPNYTFFSLKVKMKKNILKEFMKLSL